MVHLLVDDAIELFYLGGLIAVSDIGYAELNLRDALHDSAASGAFVLFVSENVVLRTGERSLRRKTLR